jgi:hypothetical protein
VAIAETQCQLGCERLGHFFYRGSLSELVEMIENRWPFDDV